MRGVRGRRIYTCKFTESTVADEEGGMLMSGVDGDNRIVGRGNHSYDHVQKLKPKVEQICRELGLQYATEENEGRIYINLTGGPAPQHLFGEGYPGGHQQHQTAQHGQGSYPGQQQHYHGGQQQHHDGGEDHQTQNNEVVNFVKRLLPRLFRSCCIVM